MMLPLLPSLATGLALLLYFVLMINVARARGRFDVAVPAMTGDPGFERVVRVHTNTAEQLILFIPALWLFVRFVDSFWGGVIGLIWVLARIFYAWGYYRDAKLREPGFVISAICSLILLIGALVGMVLRH